MKLTIQDIDSILSKSIELACDTTKKKRLLYRPLTKNYIICIDGESIWLDDNKNKRRVITEYNRI